MGHEDRERFRGIAHMHPFVVATNSLVGSPDEDTHARPRPVARRRRLWRWLTVRRQTRSVGTPRAAALTDLDEVIETADPMPTSAGTTLPAD